MTRGTKELYILYLIFLILTPHTKATWTFALTKWHWRSEGIHQVSKTSVTLMNKPIEWPLHFGWKVNSTGLDLSLCLVTLLVPVLADAWKEWREKESKEWKRLGDTEGSIALTREWLLLVLVSLGLVLVLLVLLLLGIFGLLLLALGSIACSLAPFSLQLHRR